MNCCFHRRNRFVSSSAARPAVELNGAISITTNGPGETRAAFKQRRVGMKTWNELSFQIYYNFFFDCCCFNKKREEGRIRDTPSMGASHLSKRHAVAMNGWLPWRQSVHHSCETWTGEPLLVEDGGCGVSAADKMATLQRWERCNRKQTSQYVSGSFLISSPSSRHKNWNHTRSNGFKTNQINWNRPIRPGPHNETCRTWLCRTRSAEPGLKDQVWTRPAGSRLQDKAWRTHPAGPSLQDKAYRTRLKRLDLQDHAGPGLQD